MKRRFAQLRTVVFQRSINTFFTPVKAIDIFIKRVYNASRQVYIHHTIHIIPEDKR